MTASASAGTVSRVGNTVRYDAAAGEANRVTIWVDSVVVDGFDEDAAMIREEGAPLVVGAGCVSVGAQTAACVWGGDCDLGASVVLGDGDDSAAFRTDVCELEGVTIEGGDGDDTLSAPGVHVHDVVFGGAGDDKLYGDFLYGNGGNDLLVGADNEPRANVLDGGTGDDTIRSHPRLPRCDCIDSILGGPGNDQIHAYGGDDTIRGGRGRDTIFAGAGRDAVIGDGGADVITGGRGRDVLRGASGSDTFHARDRAADRLAGGRGADRAEIDGGLDSARSIERLL